MKNRVAKFLAIFSTAAVVSTSLVTATPALADDTQQTYTLTLTNSGKTSHELEIYQIFTGDYYNDGTTETLSNIAWGSGVTAAGQTALGSAADKAKTITTEATAEAFAQELNGKLASPTATKTVAAGANTTFDNLPGGYYLVKDKASTQTGEDSAYTLYILKVVKNTTGTTKIDVPTVVKKVKDTDDTAGTTTEWQDSADYDIGDTIPYQLTGTLPSNYGKYTTYKYSFVDTLSVGLTADSANAKVYAYVDGDKTNGASGNKLDITAAASITYTNNKMTVAFTDLKTAASTLTSSSVITVDYNATLNENAVIGSTGNPNTVHLDYSNNPNSGGEGDTGSTPDDKNIVFTYKVVVNKVNPENQPLGGAAFTLFKKVKKADGTTELKQVGTSTASDTTTSFTFNGLDDGNYVLKETTTPNGYNKIADQEFTISATHDTTSDDPQLTALSGADSLNLGVVNFTSSLTDGSLTTNIVNNKGIIMPGTGGAGRYVIYGAGAALVSISIAIVAVKRKKASK